MSKESLEEVEIGDQYKNNSNKIKINDSNKILSIKCILEQNLLDINAEFSKEDVKRIFEPFFENEKDTEVFNGIIESMKEEFMERLRKKLKIQLKDIMKFFNKYVEEEKYTKESETKIFKEEKQIELEKLVEEKMKELIKLTTRVNECKEKSKEFYYEKSYNLLENNK